MQFKYTSADKLHSSTLPMLGGEGWVLLPLGASPCAPTVGLSWFDVGAYGIRPQFDNAFLSP